MVIMHDTILPHGSTHSDEPKDAFVVGVLAQCRDCGKKFLNSYYLEKHMNKRHNHSQKNIQYIHSRAPMDALHYNNSSKPHLPNICCESPGKSQAQSLLSTSNQEQQCQNTYYTPFNPLANMGSKNPPEPVNIARNTATKERRIDVKPYDMYSESKTHTVDNISRQLQEDLRASVDKIGKMLHDEISSIKNVLLATQPNIPSTTGFKKDYNTEIVTESQPSKSNKLFIDFPSNKSHKDDNRNKGHVYMGNDCQSGKKNEQLRSALQTLISFSHREFLSRTQLEPIVRHNDKPSVEEVERQLGISSGTIGSKLATHLLNPSLLNEKRSGVTALNAPLSVEPIQSYHPGNVGPGGCCYHLHQETQRSRGSNIRGKFSTFISNSLRGRSKAPPEPMEVCANHKSRAPESPMAHNMVGNGEVHIQPKATPPCCAKEYSFVPNQNGVINETVGKNTRRNFKSILEESVAEVNPVEQDARKVEGCGAAQERFEKPPPDTNAYVIHPNKQKKNFPKESCWRDTATLDALGYAPNL